MKSLLMVVLTICLTNYFTLAQSSGGKITGQLSDAINKPTIALINASDASIIQTSNADNEGRFVFGNLKAGNYKVRVSLVDFTTYQTETIIISPENLLVILPAITLQHKQTDLTEIAVTAQKLLVEHKIDKTVINVDAVIGNAGASAYDALEKVPGILIDQNGNISMQGKSGVTVYIDDKPTYLSGNDLENYLRSLSSSTLAQIELMANPPAKYDAAGNAGVINIKTKKTKTTGFNGGVNLSYAQGKYGRTNNSVNFNYRHNKINLFGNAAYTTINSYTDLTINRYFENPDGSTQSTFNQHSFIRRTRDAVSTRLGMDYYQTDKTTWGIVVNGMINPGDVRNLNSSKLFNAGHILDSIIVANSKQHNTFKNGGINFNYRHQFVQGSELTADIDYVTYQTNTNQLFKNYSYLPGYTLTHQDELSGKLPANVNIYTAKTDYTHALANGVKLAAGVKTSYTKTDNIAQYEYTIAGITKPDYDKSNHFLYQENINAAYLNANRDYKKLSVQAGLRLENTISNGHQLGNAVKPDSAFKRQYIGLFPTLYLNYKVDTAAVNQFAFNYGRRIDRPYYQSLNPFLSPLDKFTYYLGNPFLNPSYTQNFELSHTYKNAITTTLRYSKTNGEVDEAIQIINGIYYSRPSNIGSVENKTIVLEGRFNPAKWLNIYANGELTDIHSRSAFYTGVLNTEGSYVLLQSNIQVDMGKGWNLQTIDSYISKVTSAQFIINSKAMVNLAVSKKLSASTTLKLSGNEIFYTNINGGVINNLVLTKADFKTLTDSRYVVLNLSYRFGKAIANQRKHDTSGADSEKDRVKT